jgi:hypothetical protein
MPVLPLHAGDILHENTGQASDASSINVTLTGALTGSGEPASGSTISGTKLIILVHSGVDLAALSGFTKILLAGSSGSGHWLNLYYKDTSGAESSWTINTSSGTTGFQWAVWEVQRLATGAPTAAGGSTDNLATEVTQVTGSTGTLLLNDTFVVGGFGLKAATSQANMASLALTENASATLNPWGKSFDLRWATSSSTNYLLKLTRAFPFPDANVEFAADVTGTGSMSSDPAVDNFAVGRFAWTSVTSGRPDPLDHADGFEYGVTPNTASPLATRQLLDIANGTWGTQYAVSSAAPRSGTYHLRITQSAAAGRVGWDTDTLGASKDEAVLAAGFKVNSATGIVVLAEIAPASGTILQLVYDPSTTQLGLRWGAGTIAWQTYTTPLGTYAWVDISADGFTGTGRIARWSVDGLEEDGPADLTGQTASSLASVTVGLNASQTVTFDVDDICISTHAEDYPLGPHNVRLLTVDPAGTLTRTGGADTSWNVFTANGTLAGYTAASARNAIDEAPPTISTSADGLVQVTSGTSVINIPMSTYTLAVGEIIDYIGAIFALWANSAQTATLELRGRTPGTNLQVWLTTSTAFNPGSAAQPASATVPSWLRAKWTCDLGNWNQTELNGAALEIGNSTDATPDIGIHAGYLNVAIRERSTTRIYGPDDDDATVDVVRAGGSYAVVEYQVDAGPNRDLTVRYVEDGVEVAEVVTANTTETITVDSSYFDQVGRVTFEPDLSGA